MEFQDKYISKTDKEKDPESKKQVLADDVYALCESIDNLSSNIKSLRASLK